MDLEQWETKQPAFVRNGSYIILRLWQWYIQWNSKQHRLTIGDEYPPGPHFSFQFSISFFPKKYIGFKQLWGYDTYGFDLNTAGFGLGPFILFEWFVHEHPYHFQGTDEEWVQWLKNKNYVDFDDCL